jgi:hypothetical protein
MDKITNVPDSSSHLLLTGTILMANINYSDLTDYALKAVIGGAIWLMYKVAGDYISRKQNKS